MKSARILAAGAALLVGGSLAAHADGPARDPYAYTPYAYEPVYRGYDWSGFYIGGHLGGTFTATDWTATLVPPPNESVSQSKTGFAGGGHIGLQKQWSSIVLGIEVSYTSTDAEVTSSSVVPGILRSSDVNDLVLVTGRLGYAQDNLLAYAKGGYATAEIDFRTTVAPATVSSSEREHGWTAGVGLEYALRDNIILGIEYDYVKLNAGTRNLTPTALVTDAGVDMQMVLARLSFKFGPRAEAVPLK